jgi:hypothetical protein|tara:strand:- start:823 stop:1056 length:234 start_codon:yes stop_codon:yes gene_type:complete
MRNPEVINLQLSLLNKRNLPKLVENKKKKKSFFKITIILFFLIVIASLVGISTNKDSQGLSSAAAYSEPWLSERNYG